MVATAKTMPEQFHDFTASCIDAEGIYPHYCFADRGGKRTVAAIYLGQPEEIYAYLLAWMLKERPGELIYGLDRTCKDNQGTTLKDCIAGAHWNGEIWRPFIFEYQQEPRIVKPIDWNNPTWNEFIRRELSWSGLEAYRA